MTVLEARARGDGCLSDLVLDRLLVGELAGSHEQTDAESHLAGCPLCRRRYAEIEALPSQAVDAAWLRELHAAETRRRRPTLLAAGALAVTALAAVVLFLRPRAAVEPGAATTRTKGAAMALELYARRGEHAAEPVFADVPLRPGDAIRFRVRAPEAGYLTVLGLDASRRVTRYVPAAPASEAALRVEAGERALDGSVVLDEVLGEEKLFALLCPTADEAARSIAAARAALAAAASPGAVTRLPTPCQQTSASIRKEAVR